VYQLGSQSIKPLSGSLLPPGRLLVAVEERPVLGDSRVESPSGVSSTVVSDTVTRFSPTERVEV
jgi:hypothetical protein